MGKSTNLQIGGHYILSDISHRISYAFILFALITCIGNEIIEVSAIVSLELVKERNKCTYIRCFLYVKIL